MKHLSTLRELLKTKNIARDLILTKMDGEGYKATTDDQAALKGLNGEIGELETQIDEILRAQASKAAGAKRLGEGGEDLGAGAGNDDPDPTGTGQAKTRQHPAEVQNKMTFVEKTGLIVMATASAAFARRDGMDDAETRVLKILDTHGFAQFAKAIDTEMRRRAAFVKTLNASTNVSGGYLTPDSMNQDIIELLYPETTFLQGNPRTVSMPNGVYSQPAGASSATAAYRKEGARIINSEPTFKKIQMSVKFLGAIVPMTRQMLDFSIPGARAFVENDLREVMGQTMDAKAYFGDGSDGEPLGLVNQPGIITTISALGATAPTLAQIDTLTSSAKLALLTQNITQRGRWRWVMAPRTLEHISKLRVGASADGEFAYPEIRTATPVLDGIPVLVSTQIPVNLGAGSDESYIMLINFADVFFGIQEGLMLSTSSEASITINGTMVSAFENDLVFLRATSAHDVGIRRPGSVIVISGVRWGAA